MYRLTASPLEIQRIEDGCVIPVNPVNRDYRKYLEWVAEGNEPEPFIEEAIVPAVVTRRQGIQALILTGKLHLVQPAIDAIPDATQRALMQSEWDDSQQFQRNRPALIQMATAIGLTSDDLDSLFELAVTL